MNDSALSLIVPEGTQLRDGIRRKVDSIISSLEIMPPVSYSRLSDIADSLLERNNWHREYKAFVMVCTGNAIWRSVVGSVPFSRRMLLLPQCLRNSQSCKGSFDELGLLCSECGECIIPTFLREAENLGYITIVTEGTTVATRLVENGNVDAIIGVGCMEVLQKMFSAVTRYSLPAIGVPLLKCGCVDTTADEAWIIEELNYNKKISGFSLLNINKLSDKANSLFTEQEINILLGTDLTDTGKMVREILLAGGKRVRPLLTVLAYESCVSQSADNVLKHLAMSVECFHKASLIHDDIEDNDSLRYGRKTLHAKYGIPAAINAGDLLIGEGYRLLSECDLPTEIIRDCLQVISRGHKAMSIGQGSELFARQQNDVLPLDEILTIFHNKTSEAFRVSLLVGAIAGGADKSTIDILDRFSDLVGVAYQVRDDLEDFAGEKMDVYSFPHPSLLTALLKEKACTEDVNRLLQAVGNKDLSVIRSLIDSYSINEDVRNLMADYIDRIYLCLADLQNIRLRLALHEIVGKTFREYV